MSLYYNNFKYLNKNSLEEGLIVAAFEPDDGFMDSFLSMEPIQEDYYDGTKKFDYGAKYNSSYVVNISIVKRNGSDFSLSDVRYISKWLTGSRVNSWLDVGPSVDNIKYSFLGRVTNLQPRKMDGRTVGFLIEFSSIAPWAFSSPQSFDCSIGQLLDITSTGEVFISKEDTSIFEIEDNGTIYVEGNLGKKLNISDSGVVYMDNSFRTTINNQSDDLYTYIYLDIDYQNENGTYISIQNATLGEESLIKNVSPNESINISAKQFIVSNIPNKLFGDDFNFVWPRLQPGFNDFIIDGNGNGSAQFTYRYPMKVGDCAMDTNTYGDDITCDNCGGSTSDGIVRWQDIIGTPTTLEGYGITNAYNDSEVYNKIEIDDKFENIEVGGECNCTSIDENELNTMLKDVLG